MSASNPQFEITLEGLPDDLRPAEVRLRQILKLCLRGFRMRCLSVKEIAPNEHKIAHPQTDGEHKSQETAAVPGSRASGE